MALPSIYGLRTGGCTQQTKRAGRKLKVFGIAAASLLVCTVGLYFGWDRMTGSPTVQHLLYVVYCKAAEQGYPKAQRQLGNAYNSGEGVAKDEAEAVRWYRKAAEQGDADAQTILGSMYEYGGGGLSKDDTEAASWFRKAAEQGDAGGQYCLGEMYENGRGGLPQDNDQAESWYRKAAAQGNPLAQTNLDNLKHLIPGTNAAQSTF
jgi:TPR repeat protein